MDAGTDIDLASNDLGPLAWVLDELRKSLESASAALRRFVRDAGQARGSDMASVDAGQLRIARQQLHQAVGALEMVGLGAPAHMLRAMEAAVQRFTERPELCVESAATRVERAGVALTEYLEGVLQGKLTPALALFPQYRDVQELAGSDRIHPADLWFFDWRWNEPALPAGVQPQAYAPAVRSRLDQAVLRLVKSGEPAAASGVVDTCLGLAAAQPARQPRVFWQLCAAFFEAVAHGLIPFDVYAKRAASRVLMQYASLAKGELGVSDRQAQDLLFFCAQATPHPLDSLPALDAVREAWGLARHRAVDYEQVLFGRFDPALLAQMRKRIGHAKESWSALAGGDVNRLRQAVDQFGSVADTLLKLHPGSAPLARALLAAAETVTRTGQPPAPELAMEVATAVLYLEAAFQDLDPSDAQLVERTGHLAQRLDRVRQDGHATVLEPWMEELYRRVSDRQTMGSVVGELRTNLGELEKQLDAFFRKPQDTAMLQSVPGHLQQMRGVLSVLGLDQAVQAVTRMRDTVEDMLLTELDEQKARAAGTFDKLGNNLGALGFLIDMLNYQPALAKKLFIYDESAGELRPLMGRVTTPAPLTEEPAPSPAADLLLGSPAQAEASAPAVPSVPSPPAVDPAETDEELLDIFLEEAREVAGTGLEAVATLASHPADAGAMTTLRRAFHTLKGSSRMVGLTEFGEAAWSLEQVLNTWLADQKPASEDLCGLAAGALRGFQRWIEDIAGGTDAGWKAAMFRGPADALRIGGSRLPLTLPGQAPAPASLEPVVPQPGPETAGHPLPAPAAALDDLVLDFDALEPVDPQTPLVAPAAGAPADAPIEVPADAQPEPVLAQVETSELDIDWDALVAAEADVSPAPAPVAQSGDVPDASADEVPPQEQDSGVGQSTAADLQALFEVLESEPAPAAHEPPALEPAADEGLTLDLDAPGTSAEPVLSDLGLLDSPDFNASTPGGLESQTMDLAALDEFQPVDEQTKVIGDLRIGIPLYNVYLNEADEWSRRLQQEVGEWALELARPVPESTVGLAHALGGSSATVGFHALSGVARSLEAALQHTRMLGRGTPAHGGAFVQAADEIRRLLHQFAAGFLKDADPAIVATLDALAASPLPVRADFRDSSFEADPLGASGVPSGTGQPLDMPAANEVIPDLVLEPLPAPVASNPADEAPTPGSARADEAEAEADLAAMFQDPEPAWADPAPAAVESAPVLADAWEPVAPVPDAAPATDDMTAVVPAQAEPLSWAASEFAAIAPTIAQATVPGEAVPATLAGRAEVIEGEEDIDAVDAIDPDLFPVFEDEAAELLPRLGTALRGWAGGDAGGRDPVLRALHTLKGSARLAGALRLGEMAHRMESAVEQLPQDGASAAEIDPLLQRLDALLNNFERLRLTGVASAGAEAAAQALSGAEAPAVADDTVPTAPANAEPAAQVPAARPVLPVAAAAPLRMAPVRAAANQAVRVRSQLLERLMNRAGEVMITRSRLENELRQLRSSLSDLTGNLDRLRAQLRDIELQAETQMQSRLAQAKDSALGFDPLEFDRFTRVQELTRMMAESVNDVATVQRNLQRTVEATEDDLIAQARQTRELQRDLLRTRMVEFDAIADRLYRVVRLASKETGKQVKLDITGASIEMDRGVLDRMVPAFEHLLRNCVAHGIETPQQRLAAGKDATGTVQIALVQEGNDVSVAFRDDGAGLDLDRIRDKAVQQGLLAPDQVLDAQAAANLIFMPGLSTATEVTELSGRGIGMDVVRSEVNALGGRIETTTQAGAGTVFKLVLPLTTAVTQVVMLRSGDLVFGVPSNLVELVRRATVREVETAYASGSYAFTGESLPFFWSGALLQASGRSREPAGRTLPVVVLRSAAQRVAVHVDEVLGNQEVVVKNLGPQLARLPGLAGMTVLPSGAVVLIYNPVALAAVYGEQALGFSAERVQPEAVETPEGGVPVAVPAQAAPQVPLVLVVDDSITVRRVTQRLLTREGWRVALAADGLQALERLAEERPALVLSDIEMPRMDGFDLVRNIRADARWADLPVVMITSRIAGKHRDHARELGVNHYLGKPYAEEELLSLVRHYAARAAADASTA